MDSLLEKTQACEKNPEKLFTATEKSLQRTVIQDFYSVHLMLQRVNMIKN